MRVGLLEILAVIQYQPYKELEKSPWPLEGVT